MNRGFSTGLLAEPQALASEGANSGDVGGSMVGLPLSLFEGVQTAAENLEREGPSTHGDPGSVREPFPQPCTA